MMKVAIKRMLIVSAALILVLAGAALFIAYIWEPTEEHAYEPAQLAATQFQYVDTALAHFRFIKTGQGPPVVLVPGGTLTVFSYRQTVVELAARFTVYAVELPGQGYTTVLRESFPYDIEGMSLALASFMDAVGLQRTSLVGHSWGGTVSVRLAQTHPERIDKLVLIATPVLDVPSSWDFRALELPLVGEAIGKLMTKSSFERTLRKAFAHQERLTSTAVDEYWAALSRRENRRALWLQQRNFDYSLSERQLGDVRAATLILWGSEDRFDGPWQAQELGRRIHGSTVRILRGCGHNVHEDCPDQANSAITDHLVGLSGASH